MNKAISQVQELLSAEIEKLDQQIDRLQAKKNELISAANIIEEFKTKEKTVSKPKKSSDRKYSVKGVCCGREFRQNAAYQRHINFCDNFKSNDIITIKVPDKYEPAEFKEKQYEFENGRYRCLHCNFFTTQLNLVQQHVRNDCIELKDKRKLKGHYQ